VALPADVDLALVKTADVVSANAGLFAECTPPKEVVPTNLDCYLLTVSPASGYQGSTSATYPSGSGVASICASRNTVEGVKFCLLPLGVSTSTASDATTLAGQAVQLYAQLKPLFAQVVGLTPPASTSLQAQIAPLLSTFRNVVAHLCFGTDTLSTFPANPFPPATGASLFDEYGALDALREPGILTDCAVPLALVYWTAAGVQFVDMWSVRRPVVCAPASLRWPVFSGDRRCREGLAIFLQFQQHMAELGATLGSSSLSSVTAQNFFRYLPAAGLLPVAGGSSSTGFSSTGFFANLISRNPVFIEGLRMEATLQESFLCPPADTTTQEMIWLYSVRENMQAIASVPPTSTTPYLLFTTGYLPYKGEPQFNLSRWNFSNFALVPRP